MSPGNLASFKADLLKSGFTAKAILSDAEFAKALACVAEDPRVIKAPDAELRYIEGLLELPLGFIKFFNVIPKDGYEKCKCGRTPSALEIVAYARRKALHSTQLMRDVLTGFHNTFEIAQDGREGECINCGRKVVMSAYFSHDYMYA